MEQVYGKTPRSLIFDGKHAEAFSMVTKAELRDGVPYLDGVAVQVINPDRDWIKVEFTNEKGKDGWCSRSAAPKTALLFPRGYVVVPTVELMRYAQARVMEVGDIHVTRTNSVAFETGRHRMFGKPGKKDAYTIIHKTELAELEYAFYKVV